MAYTDTTGDIFRVTSAWEFPNKQFHMVIFHYQVGSAGTGDSRIALANNANSGVVTHLQPIISNQVTFWGSRVSTIKAALPFNPVVAPSNAAGNSPDAPIPSQVRGLITWLTDFSGPAYRGRTFSPTPATTTIGPQGEPTAALLTQLTNWKNFLLTPVVSGGTTWSIGVLHYVKRTTVSQPIGWTPIKSGLVSSTWATQRRGGDRGRPNNPPW